MTRDDLDRLLLLHGADPAGWPDGVRAGAEALLENDPGARALLQRTQTLDKVLDEATAPAPVDAALQRKVMTRIAERTARRDWFTPRLGLAGAAAVVLVTAFAGYLAGAQMAIDPAAILAFADGGFLLEGSL